MAHSTGSHVLGLLKHWAHYLGLRRFKSSKVTSIFTMDYIFAQSTWLVKALLSVLQLFFSPAFSSLDSQPTWPLGKENAGLLQSCLALNLFCFMDYIHDQLTQLLQNETTLFKNFLVFVFFFIFLNLIFFVSFLISLSYRPFKQGHRSGPPNIAFRCSQASIPAREGDECNSRTTASSSDLTFSQSIVWV